MNESSGTIPFNGYRTWYRMVGTAGAPPLLVLHGGPGFPHDYLEDLSQLAVGRQVIFYDQLGCGNSDQPDDPSLWTVELFVQELKAVREALGLKRLHLLGHSWGGMLAMEYMLRQPSGIQSLILYSSLACMPLYLAETQRLRQELPPEVVTRMEALEGAGQEHTPEYEALVEDFMQRYVYRQKPQAQCYQRAGQKSGLQVYSTMGGSSEFDVRGVLKNWDISDRLGEIDVPTLCLNGIYDECTPIVVKQIVEGIPGCRWVLLPHSAHLSHLEQPQETLAAFSAFLNQHDPVE